MMVKGKKTIIIWRRMGITWMMKSKIEED